MGYAPLRLVLGTSVYALGFAGGIVAMFSSLSRGEVNAITELVYEARGNCLALASRWWSSMSHRATMLPCLPAWSVSLEPLPPTPMQAMFSLSLGDVLSLPVTPPVPMVSAPQKPGGAATSGGNDVSVSRELKVPSAAMASDKSANTEPNQPARQ